MCACVCVCLTLHAFDTVTVSLTFLQHVISMPRMLCVVCVLFGTYFLILLLQHPNPLILQL